MLHQPPEAFAAPHAATLWTGEVKVRFLDCLAQQGNVRLACRRVGLSAETAYRQRRRDPVFARAWAAAMALARSATEEILAQCAVDGVEEEIWYRGELHGTKRRFDTRLFLAHLSRLDEAVTEEAELDSDRFDELLAVIAGETPPESGTADEDPVLPDPDLFVVHTVMEADAAVLDRLQPELDSCGRFADGEEEEACKPERQEARARARQAAAGQWDRWLARAHGRVDALLAAPAAPGTAEPSGAAAADGENAPRSSLRTLSTVSTPALARALADRADSSCPTVKETGEGDAH